MRFDSPIGPCILIFLYLASSYLALLFGIFFIRHPSRLFTQKILFSPNTYLITHGRIRLQGVSSLILPLLPLSVTYESYHNKVVLDRLFYRRCHSLLYLLLFIQHPTKHPGSSLAAILCFSLIDWARLGFG